MDGGEEEHHQTQLVLPPERFPALSRVPRAGVTHDPDRLFELGLDGLILALRGQPGRAQ
ncbi:MAG TPA: hypothetical protein VGI00_11125 [Streptosporangiaceae bacterium]